MFKRISFWLFVSMFVVVLVASWYGAAYALTYKELAAQFEEKNSLPSGLLQAICEIESGWRPHAIGRDGEIGLCQLKPQTLALLCPGCNPEVLLNPYDNLHWAARYLTWLMKVLRTDNQATLAVAYNGGQGSLAARYLIRLEKVQNGPPIPTTNP